MNSHPHMFKAMTIRGKTFRNRVMASPVTTARIVSENGTPTSECIDSYETKARGGVGAVTVTETFVDFDRGARHDHSINLVQAHPSVHHLESLFLLTEGIKSHGAVASIQLNHIGNVNHPSSIKDGKNPIGPSGFIREDGIEVEEMDEEMMRQVADNFALAAQSAEAAGFDMIMVHGGHGWLLGQFISPLTNKRQDGYGGSLENRAKFPIMVLDRIRESCPNLLIEYRLSGSERVSGGIEIEEAAMFAKLIQDKVDLIHVTSGLYHNHVYSKAFSSMFHDHGCNLDLSEAIKKAVDIPVVAVGGFNSPEQIEEAIATGKCDFVALGRQLMADPDFVRKTAEGLEDEIAPCLRCSCFNPLAPDPDKRPSAEPFQCTVNPYSMRELRMQWQPPVKSSKKVLVVGGGPGGMYAAITAAQRGHQVTLVEKENTLGGALWFTEYDHHKEDLKRYKNSLITRVHRAGVKVITGVEVTQAYIDEQNPDKVIMALGATAVVPPIKGIDKHARYALDVYTEPEIVGKEVILIGGGLVGMETALHLADVHKAKVTVIEMQDDFAKDAFNSHRQAIQLFMPDTVTVLCNTKCQQVEEGNVVIENKQGVATTLEGDTILYAVGMKPRLEEAQSLFEKYPNARIIGDANRPARVLEAVRDGMFAAYDI